MTDARPSVADKRRAFQLLHQSGCFAIPNPWDVGSAVYLQELGFKALATTSAGFSWSRGRPDGGSSLAMVLAHLREMVEATDLPVNADFEDGFAPTAAGVADNARRSLETGIAGLSIEDSTGDDAKPLYELPVAVERMRAARAAIDRAGGDAILVGRAECFLVGRPDIDETLARLKAYAHAGADCLYAPGLQTREQVAAVVSAVAPKPVNVLVGAANSFTLQELASMGVRRVSVGAALARVAWGAYMQAAKLIAGAGSFDGFSQTASGKELNAVFQRRRIRRN
jgi:2-methylisocitrate lyase-like PEP mutase family enzyme